MKRTSPLSGILIGIIAVLVMVIFSLAAHLKRTNAACEKEISQKIKAEERLSQAEKKITALQKEVSQLKAKNASLKESLGEREKDIKGLNSQVASLQEEIKKLNNLKNSLEESLKDALSNNNSR